MFTKRISIFTGHFGSGKTEVAVNYALELKKRVAHAAIIDFDIVNPFFRTADVKDQLEGAGLWVVTPLYANTNVDVPALPPETNALFEKKEYHAVFDVGGDDLGARAVSRYRDEILQDSYEMLFVINTRRPMTDTPEKIEEMIWSIEQSSRMKVTHLVNNTNLLSATTVADVLEGGRMIEEVSRKLDIPVAFTSIRESMAAELSAASDTPVLPLTGMIKLPWDK